MAYEPGRRLRTASSVRARASAIWASYAALAVIGLQLVHHDTRTILTIAAIAVPFIYSAIVKQAIARYNAAFKHAVAPLHKGDPATSDTQLAELAERFRWPRFLPRLAGYNRSLALLRLGRHDDAIALLSDIDARGGVLNVDAAIAGTLAYLHALRGNVELAEVWLREDQRRRAYQAMVAGGPFPDSVAVTALELRRGEYREVATRLADQWKEMEHTMTGQRLQPLRVFRAFAVAQADVRDAGAATPILASLGSAHYGEFAYLGASWPELDTFLRTNLPA